MTEQPLLIEVFPAEAFVTTEGVMKGEVISFADELVLDDLFEMRGGAQPREISLIGGGNGAFRQEAAAGDIYLDSCIQLMSPDGGLQEALILVSVLEAEVEDIAVLPLGELVPSVPYRLVGVDRHTATRRFADAASGSFARGTHITRGDGRMQPIETLMPGDDILTRDAGRQPLRWIGQTTLRATGVFAPVVIAKGALHNERDLVVRADHRLFVYQREDRLGAGRAEVLIKARHLLNHDTVTRRRGGFVDYFQLIFDEHHFIYAEGIAAESHLIDPRTRYGLPRSLDDLHHAPTSHTAYEVRQTLVDGAETAALLRNASAR